MMEKLFEILDRFKLMIGIKRKVTRWSGKE